MPKTPLCVFCPSNKKTSGNLNLKLLNFSQLLVQMPYEIIFLTNFVYTPSQHFWDTQYKIINFFFILSKKFFNKPYLKIFLDSILFFLEFWDLGGLIYKILGY